MMKIEAAAWWVTQRAAMPYALNLNARVILSVEILRFNNVLDK